jgi:hypothetical protein
MKVKAAALPHSWTVADWPAGVFPNRQNSARNLVRDNRAELIECGALMRVGKMLVISGEGYARFLSRRMGGDGVTGYTIAANRARGQAVAT